MKQMKLWMLAAILACGQTVASAQETKHEIGISYGAGSNSTLLSFLEDLESVTITAGSVTYDNDKYFGPLAVEYFYHLTPLIGVGGVAAYVHTDKDLMHGKTKLGNAKVNYLSLLPAMKLGWFERDNFSMYSKLAAGVSFRSDKQEWEDDGKSYDDSESKVSFNFQCSLIGMEVGSKTFRGFAELGFGEQGIILAGLRYKF